MRAEVSEAEGLPGDATVHQKQLLGRWAGRVGWSPRQGGGRRTGTAAEVGTV